MFRCTAGELPLDFHYYHHGVSRSFPRRGNWLRNVPGCGPAVYNVTTWQTHHQKQHGTRSREDEHNLHNVTNWWTHHHLLTLLVTTRWTQGWKFKLPKWRHTETISRKTKNTFDFNSNLHRSSVCSKRINFQNVKKIIFLQFIDLLCAGKELILSM